MGGLLDGLSRQMEDAVLMDRVAERMIQFSDSDPDAWMAYLEEGRSWLERTDDPIAP